MWKLICVCPDFLTYDVTKASLTNPICDTFNHKVALLQHGCMCISELFFCADRYGIFGESVRLYRSFVICIF